MLTAAVLSTVAHLRRQRRRSSTGRGHHARNEATGKVGFIGSGIDRPIDSGFSAADPAAEVADVVRDEPGRASSGSPPAAPTLRTTEQHATAGGGTAVRLAQTVHGIPVLGGEFVVNLDRGQQRPVRAR